MPTETMAIIEHTKMNCLHLRDGQQPSRKPWTEDDTCP